MFHLIDMTDADIQFLSLEVHDWIGHPGFKKFYNFVSQLTVLNDPAEWGCLLIKVILNYDISCFNSF